MHDPAVPAEILNRPGRLTDVAMSMVKTHSEIGYQITKDIEFPWPVAEMIYQHHEHERLDGSGYPRGLQGDEIIIEAQIIAIADVVEAIDSHRPYRVALGLDTALDEITSQDGIKYNADAVVFCMELFREGTFEFEGNGVEF